MPTAVRIDPYKIAYDLRFDDDPVAFYDSLVKSYGLYLANEAWMQACRIYDEAQFDA